MMKIVLLSILCLYTTLISAFSCTLPNELATDFANVNFDYLVIGSGAGGLPVANRLSENPDLVIGLIEAGIFHDDEPLVDVPANGGEAEGNPNFDWAFSTVPQSNAGERIVAAPRGKMLGGSTGLNLMAWNRASKIEYDAWQCFSGAGGWNWSNILPFMIKSEAVDKNLSNPFPGITPSEEKAAEVEYILVDGFTGNVKPSFNVIYPESTFPFVEAMNSLGIRTNPEPYGGNTTGIYNSRMAIDRETGKRTYAAKAYYCPASNRSNLHVLTQAQVTKILLHQQSNKLLSAAGVTFTSGGSTFAVNASKEIILAAGTVQTPQLLELSGIGSTQVLSSLGIKTLVDLPGVGENLWDHIYVPSQFTLDPTVTTFDQLRINSTFFAQQSQIYNTTGTGFLAATDGTFAFLPLQALLDSTTITSLLATLENSTNVNSLSPIQKLQYDIQIEWVKGGLVPQTETILFSKGFIDPQPDTTYITVLNGIVHPFSRGSIHINTTDPLSAPVIDPKYLSNAYDSAFLGAMTQTTETLAAQPALANIISSRVAPPSDVSGTDAFINYAASTFQSGSHLSGTAAMAERSLGGVVDTNLIVYGTNNLRIADASIIPIPIAAHLQTTAYAIGEKAAELILHI